MSKKSDYKIKNEAFLEELRGQEGVMELPCGILYRVIQEGEGERYPNLGSVVTVHYSGSLINGRMFDDSRERGCPEAFRLRELVTGWQIALQRMRAGDRWEIYIPAAVGYGTRTSGPIPGNSTLIFDIELLGVV